MSDEDLQVVIQDDESDSVAAREAAGGGGDDPAVALRAQVEEANRKTEEIRAARQADQEAARLATERAARAEAEVADSRLETVDSGLTNAAAQVKRARADIKAAMDAGDGDALADATERLAEAKRDELRLTEAKADIEARKTAPLRREQQESQEHRRQLSRAEMIDRATKNTDAKSAAWIRANQDVFLDRYDDVMRAHSHAVGEGIPLGSDDYLAHIETRLGMRQAASQSKGQVQQGTRRTAPVAPVSGGGGASYGASDAGAVRLTKAEAASATDGTLIWNYDDPSGKNRFKKGDPIGVQEMARRKLKGIKEGLYDKSYQEAG